MSPPTRQSPLLYTILTYEQFVTCTKLPTDPFFTVSQLWFTHDGHIVTTAGQVNDLPVNCSEDGSSFTFGSNWICHTFLFFSLGTGTNPKCSILFIIISITLYHETVDKVHDVDDFKSYHFHGNSVEMTEYPIIIMLFVQFWTMYMYIFNTQHWSSIVS